MKVKNILSAIGKWFKKTSHIVLVSSLILVLLGGFVASMIQTNFFSYEVFSQTIPAGNDLETSTSKAESAAQESGVTAWSTADIYRPKTVAEGEKIPLVFVVPGIQRTKETQASFCIELVRRGYAVICIDPSAQGESSSSYESQAATTEGYGLFYWMDYLFDHLEDEFSYVDPDFVGACGHSAGGNACQKLAEREGNLATDKGWAKSRLNAVYITGFIRDFKWNTTRCNVGISYSYNDEGAFQNKTAQKKTTITQKQAEGNALTAEESWWLTVGNADMRYAEESVTLVNYQLTRWANALGSEKVQALVADMPVSYDAAKNKIAVNNVDVTYGDATFREAEVTLGYEYGNPFNYTYCVVNNESAIHALMPYDGETIGNLVNFFTTTFETETQLSASDQIWWGKELGCMLVLVGDFAFMCALCCVLLETKAFASVRKPLPARTGDQKVKGRIIFWISFVISAVIACLLYMVCVGWSTTGIFETAKNGMQTWVFPQRFTNAVMLWAVANGLIGIAIFFLTWGLEWVIDHVRAAKAEKASLATEKSAAFATKAEVRATYLSKLEPLKLGGMDVVKTLGLALILILSFFAIDYAVYGMFHVDARFLFISARVSFNGRAILAMLMYIPIFFIFYFSNSLRVNCSMRPSNWPEWLSQLIAVLGNTLGLIAILFLQYIPYATTGTIGFTDTTAPQWLFVNQLFSIIPMMAALPLFNRFFFNKTGRAWLGAIVICTIFIIMTGGATTMYYAL